MMKRLLGLGMMGAIFLLAQGCSGASASSSAKLNVYMTDNHLTDANVSKVLITISDMSIHSTTSTSDQGWIAIPVTAQQPIDLLALTNPLQTLLGQQGLPAGTYEQLRLAVSEATVVLKDGTQSPVKIPSGFLRLNFNQTTFKDGQQYGMLLDFDAEKSLKETGAGWVMAPPVIFIKDIYVINPDGSHTSIFKAGDTTP